MLSPCFMIYRSLTLAAVLCGLSMQGGVAQERVARTLSEPPFSGELKGIAKSGDLTFATNAGERVVAADRFVTWGAMHDSADGTQVLLADGSLIVAGAVKLEGQSIVVEANLFGSPEGVKIEGTSRLPVSAVKAIVFRVPLLASKRDALFDRIENAKGNEDEIWLANGDVLTGAMDRLQPHVISINTADGPLAIEPGQAQGRLLEKVTALVFNPLLVRPVRRDGSRVLVGFTDGSRLFVEHLKPDDEQLGFILACGATFKSHPDENIVKRIASLQSLSPEIQYVSGLAPHSYRHTPLLDRDWPLGVDESVSGGRLRSSGHVFVRGIGMHSNSAVIYPLKKRYRRFEALLAIDESAGDAGSVNFIVRTVVDGKFQTIYPTPVARDSHVVRGGDQPLPISVDITGLTNLALFVTDADGGAQMDRANWLNARLIE